MDNVIVEMGLEAPWTLAFGAAAVALPLVGLAVFGKELYLSYKCRHIPCGEPPLPILGHALTLMKGNVFRTFMEWSRKHGDLVRFHAFGTVYILCNNPQDCKRVLSTNIKSYKKDPSTYTVFSCLLGNGLITSEGDRWHAIRRKLAPVFKLEILGDVGSAAGMVTRLLFKELDKAAETGEEIDLAEHLRRVTLQVISVAVLGISPEESEQEVSNLYLPIIDECNDRIWYPQRIYLPTPAWWQHWSKIRQLNSYIEGKVRKRWASFREEQKNGQEGKKGSRTILDSIFAGMDEPVQFGSKEVLALRDEIKSFLFAGHDTTSCMITWAFWEMMKNKSIMDKVLEEANGLFPKPDSDPSFDQLRSALPYTFNVLRESLRTRSPVPVIPRECLKSDVLSGREIPKGAVVVVNMDTIHKTAEFWPGDDVLAFRPDRFGKVETTSPQTGLGEGVDQWAFLPFINGPRNCLGQHFSLLEARVVTALLVQRYDFTPAPGQDDTPHPYKIPITPITGMKCIVKRRK
mmetsp:Transcript_39752/g.94237  ORF Transcript_39752/g.94237 Transcript_39752/m.94237 type:complete len:517 (+) Transcript_39752:166-1716(+)|eukprot:CAMPEP_0177727282 /NCGR_PEP_ID=MMETSP0484_2-20121128/20237_1 /TAXON_ID=354590 /ORGANISM="Rhodomonas lens, Strain RHODO" /LENGTH=516 /DNA_ID=CAMNT_0019239923 /DNA_START=127 /DNA_END=1677 /DNA_ORIENTATION=-